ncbi:UNVERIFIED_CONTAM: hypothetical protein PYX00_007284 [Menopon gallinae]|uniref:JNK1/MAPK8-associated membrane protein n=1 Tax=Menopon gallinae TaxID=328185 RepID=A0AAW2HI60_9NEOP
MHCPGLYCGRTLLENGNWSDCGACPRGYRTNSSYCIPCNDSPEFYDWLYLAFVVLVVLVLHWFCIDLSTPKKSFSKDVFIIHLSALIEVCIAAAVTLLLVEPFGTWQIRSCKVKYLSDWYTLFHNPNPNYEEVLLCTQEAVYPLYSMVFIFYSLATIVMLIIRLTFSKYFVLGKMSLYAALHFYPVIAFIQAIFGGIIYYTFPYLVIVATLISSAIHFAQRLDQSMVALVLYTVTDPRNLVILFGHWSFLAYGIVSAIELKGLSFQWSLESAILALVPVPTVFYILTAKFTDPSKVHIE